MSAFEETRRKLYLRSGFRHHLLVLQSLMFALPVTVIVYISNRNGVAYETSQLLLVAMVLVLVLAGMMMLRQFFDRFLGIAVLLEDTGMSSRKGGVRQPGVEELRQISFSFNRLMQRFERVTDELRRRVFELFAIRDLTEVASRVLDIDELLKALLEKAMAVSGARIGSAFFYENENCRLRMVDHRGLTPGPEKNSYIQINRTVLRHVVREKKSMLITNIADDPRTCKPNDSRYGAPSFLALPILARSGVIAVLSLANKTNGKAFDKEDERILTILIQEIGFAVENAILHADVAASLRKLQESEEKYRSILESIHCGYYETDLRGRLVFFNEPLVRMLDAPTVDMTGCDCGDYLDTASVERLRGEALAVLESGKPCTVFECTVPGGQQQSRFIEASIFLMHNVAGEPTGFRGMVRDISERKIAEAQQRRLENRLKKRQRLEAIGTLAGGVAHNFNNLLMGIQGNAELLQFQPERGGGAERKLSNIHRLVRQGARLTAQLLGYAREGKYEPKPMDLNLLVRDIAETLQSTCKRIRFQTRLAAHLPVVVADPGQMTQVMMNVMLNATEAMTKGGELVVETAAVSPADLPSDDFQAVGETYVRLTFTDTGPGMDHATLDRAFDPFFTTKGRDQQGRGMGLASVYGIVKAHDGAVEIQSCPEQGTTVSVFLPATVHAISAEAESRETVARGEATVLMVDDEEIVLEVGAMMLRSLGYRVFEASNGSQALEMMQQNRDHIDLVILDMIMPEMSGEEVFERLRAVKPGVRILLSSGYTLDGQADQLLARGCDGFLQKPFGLVELGRAIWETIGRAAR